MKLRFFRLNFYILFILVVAAILRFYQIDQPFIDAFSWRQSSTAMMADNFYRTNRNIFYPEVNWGGAGPGYQGREFQTVSYLAALLYPIVGQQDWVGRSIAVMFGLWGIFALYQLVRRVWDEEHALMSAAVMALLPGSIFIERSFLPDPAMVALVTTSLWMLVAYLQTGRRHYLILAGVIGSWGFLSKITGLIVGLPMMYAIVTILGRKKMLHPKKLGLLGVVAVLGLIPVVAYYLWARHLSLSYPPYHFAGEGNWLWDDGLTNWLSKTYFLPGLSHIFNTWLWTAPVIALVFFGLIFPPPREKPTQNSPVNFSGKAPWLFHWWFLGGVIYYLIGAKELVNNPWNFHLINPAAAAIAGHAILVTASLWNPVWRSPISLSIIAAFLFFIASFGQAGLQWVYKPYAYESYKLGLALRQFSQPGDLVVTLANTLGDPIPIYYSQRRGWVFPPVIEDGVLPQFPEDDNEAIQMFEEMRAKGADWLGIVEERKKDFWTDHLTLVEHIKRTCEFKAKTPEWVIYRIFSPEEMAKLP
ncbi:MAG: glycosyltransferase family 39 protein [Kastovskya adunca ATA6-11-RM4]|jgi:uncharacterized membrane protein YuzA (DUF378 family)|nr:glycosyltransferase family 39 protein [Kastovskya adunca ATA6-11-RM4]